MLPDPEALTDFRPTERLSANARPAPPWRDELRRIPNMRNAFGVLFLYAQTIGIVVAAVWLDNWMSIPPTSAASLAKNASRGKLKMHSSAN